MSVVHKAGNYSNKKQLCVYCSEVLIDDTDCFKSDGTSVDRSVDDSSFSPGVHILIDTDHICITMDPVTCVFN